MFLEKLKHTLDNSGHIVLQRHKSSEKDRPVEYTNRYTINDLFLGTDIVESLKNELKLLKISDYLYTVEDKTILDKYKNTSNNLINKTPFFIWQNNMKRTNIKEVTSQLNILPTTLNLFGINYNPNYYIGSDALSQNYKGIVFFSDYSWYDGNIYVENGVIANNKSSSQEYLDEKNYYIHYLTKKNDLALKYNVFKKST